MSVSAEDLRAIMPHAKQSSIDRFVGPLNDTMDGYEIDTPERQAMFLAQIAHESGSLRYTEEIASGEAYEWREDLGNTKEGDGVRFKGHGLIQLTGRANHEHYAADKEMSVEDVLVYLQTAEGAADVAGWFWHTKHLNEHADRGDFRRITKIINGGLNGWGARLTIYERAQDVLA